MKIWKSLLFTALLSCGVTAAPVELDKVAVIVNDGVILQSDIDTAMKTLSGKCSSKRQEPTFSKCAERPSGRKTDHRHTARTGS